MQDVTGTVSLLTPVWNYVDALTPVAAQKDALTMARHRAFIAPRLLGSLAALASLPVYLVLRGEPSAIELGIFSWLAIPIFIVCYLSRTGRYETAHILSVFSLTSLVFLVALFTGGITSFAAIWLAVVPLETALSGSRCAVLISAIGSTAAGLLLLLLSATGLIPNPASTGMPSGLAALAIISASLYAAGLALGINALLRAGEQLLNAEEDRYRFIARNMTDVIIRFGRNGSVVFVSPAAEALFGVPVSGLVGTGLFDRVHVTDRPAFLSVLADAAESTDERSLEFRVRRDCGAYHPGRMVWVEMHCRSLDRVGERPDKAEVAAVLRDVGERKSQEAAVGAAQAELAHANAVKNRFIASMSHELRTPLNAIIGFSDMLMNGSVRIPSSQVEYAKLINSAGRHLLSMVNDILDASKIESGRFELARERFAPGPVIESATDLLALQAREAGLELRLRLARNLPDIEADRRALSQVLINLISNAIKFTPCGGHVTVSASRDRSNLILAVEDTGVGIKADDLPRLGEAFFQVSSSPDRRHDGSGLGLSIVKGLVALHDGDVDIRSRFGEGTCVTVRLPLTHSDGRISVQPGELTAENEYGKHDRSDNQVRKSA